MAMMASIGTVIGFCVPLNNLLVRTVAGIGKKQINKISDPGRALAQSRGEIPQIWQQLGGQQGGQSAPV